MSNYESGFTIQDLRSLEKAIAEGAKKVKYADKEIEYRSVTEMMEARRIIKEALGLSGSAGKKGLFGGRRIVGIHSKGLIEDDK